MAEELEETVKVLIGSSDLDLVKAAQQILMEIKHRALVIVANEVSGGLADPHAAVESVEACACLIDEVSPGIAAQIRSYVGTQSPR